ncbi:MAG: hypothetical protein J5529_08970 [Prevotella sp.]|nr:hypothetical protein [Prevotella sp.]
MKKNLYLNWLVIPKFFYSAGAKIGGGSEMKIKNCVFYFAFRSPCTIFAKPKQTITVMGIYINTGNEGFRSTHKREYKETKTHSCVIERWGNRTIN